MAPHQELKVLGSALAEMQDHALSQKRRPATSERLAAIHRANARAASAPGRLFRPRWLGLVAVAAVALIAVAFRARPLGFVVGTAKTQGRLGVWVSAAFPEATALAFSDGSRMQLSAGAQARVVSTTQHGARVVIERGTLRSDVVPRAENDWFVVGGPFEIHVTGTSFDASWEPEQQALRVTMYEGHVVIRADCLRAARSLAKGDSATLSCQVEHAPSAPSQSGASAPLPSQAPDRAPTATRVTASAEASAPASAKSAQSLPVATEAASAPSVAERGAPSWRELAQQGAYKAALSAAEQAGFDDSCNALSAADLLQLGTTARLAGSATRAAAAYTAVRRRFPDSDGAAVAAFHLGQMAFDGSGAYAAARDWFITYLRERPSGGLAAEALGRQLEAEQRLGDLSAARATAASYLARYPGGAHARVAKSILEP